MFYFVIANTHNGHTRNKMFTVWKKLSNPIDLPWILHNVKKSVINKHIYDYIATADRKLKDFDNTLKMCYAVNWTWQIVIATCFINSWIMNGNIGKKQTADANSILTVAEQDEEAGHVHGNHAGGQGPGK